MTNAALHGVRVLDLSRILAGPLAGQYLGDFGAEVIKVERPGKGDDARRLGGVPLRAPDGTQTDFAPMYVCSNRNKKSICVDITTPDGQALVCKLADWADVLIENYKVGDLGRYGLDYESLALRNPRLVYCSITGFGQTGPYASRAGFDSVFQAMSGLMSMTGRADDAPGGGPTRVGIPITDFIGGLHAFSAIMVALHHRDQVSGRGQHIDIALLDAAISGTTIGMTNYFSTGERFQRCGNEQATTVPSQVFSCSDGPVLISAPTDEMFGRLCRALGCPRLAEDSRYSSGAERARNRDSLTAALGAIMATKRRGELFLLLEEQGVATAPVNEVDQVFADPQVRHRRNDIQVEHPVLGTMRIGTNPMRLSSTPVLDYSAPPMLGEHTDSVLRDVLGLSDVELTRLRQARAI